MKAAQKGILVLFILFLLGYFLVPYGTKYLGFGLHNLVLIAIFPPALAYALSRKLLSRWEWILLLGGSSSLLLSAFIHQAPFAHFRAYLLAFVTYIVVRVGMRALPPEKLIQGLGGYLILAGGLSLLQIYVGPAFYPAAYLSPEQPFYAVGFAHHPSMGALFLIWPLGVLAGEIVRRSALKPFLLAAFFVGSYALALTFSRGALLGFATSLGLLGVLSLRKGKGSLKRYGMVLALVILGMTVAWSVPNRYSTVADEKIISKIPEAGPNPTAELEEELRTDRLFLWKAVVWLIADHPVFGTGISGYYALLPEYLSRVQGTPEALLSVFARKGPHNSYLAWSVYWGLAAFLWVLGLIGLACRPLLRRFYPSVYASFLLGLIAVLIDSLFHDFIGDRLFWIALAAAAGMAIGNHDHGQTTHNPVTP